jgi:hypothetical protein
VFHYVRACDDVPDSHPDEFRWTNSVGRCDAAGESTVVPSRHRSSDGRRRGREKPGWRLVPASKENADRERQTAVSAAEEPTREEVKVSKVSVVPQAWKNATTRL